MSWLMSNMQSLHKYHGKCQASLKETHIMASLKYAIISKYRTYTKANVMANVKYSIIQTDTMAFVKYHSKETNIMANVKYAVIAQY